MERGLEFVLKIDDALSVVRHFLESGAILPCAIAALWGHGLRSDRRKDRRVLVTATARSKQQRCRKEKESGKTDAHHYYWKSKTNVAVIGQWSEM